MVKRGDGKMRNPIYGLLRSLPYIVCFVLFQFSIGQVSEPLHNYSLEAYTPPSLKAPFDVCFLNQSTGFLVGDNGSAYQTQDGGLNWSEYQPLWLGDSGFRYRRFYKRSPTHWLVGGTSIIQSTQDGGSTWQSFLSPQDPFNPENIDIHNFDGVEGLTGYAVGGHAMILKTQDGGIHWQKESQGKGILSGIESFNGENPIAVGYSASTERIISYYQFGRLINVHTAYDTSYGLWADNVNGDWSISTSSTYLLSDLNFINSTTGWAAGTDKGTNTHFVLKTINGGENWSRYPVDNSTTDNDAFDMKLQFLDSTYGYAIIKHTNLMYKTVNGGISWTSLSLPENYLTNMYFIDKDNGWVVGYYNVSNGFVLKTEDGGSSWDFVYRSGIYNSSLAESIIFNSQGIGYLGTLVEKGNYAVYQTLDKGTTWHYMGSPSKNPHQLVSLAVDTLFLLSEEGLPQVSVNNGNTWSNLSSCPMEYPGEMQFYGSLTGWICGYDNLSTPQDLLYKTMDGGTHWFLAYESSPPRKLTALFFLDSKHGWMAGSADTTILATQDGGLSWNPQYIPTGNISNPDYRDIYFTDSEKGWVVDGYGNIFRTQNGGHTWVLQSSPITAAWRKICFQDSTTGWILGEQGQLLFTQEGGNLWYLTSTSFNSTFKDIAFGPEGTGWIASESSEYPLYRLVPGEFPQVTGLKNKDWEVYEDNE